MLSLFNKKKSSTDKEIPPRAKKHSIRVSKPYGLFPQDVENVLEALEVEKEKQSLLLEQFKQEVEQLKKDNEDLKTTITQLKYDMTLIEVPDGTESTDFKMINKLKKLKNKKVEAVLEDDEIEIVEI